MVQGYYTLQEAAKFLEMPLDDLKKMAQKGQIRSFQDRGTLRFRIQDIQELARLRGVTSDPELLLGDASLPAAPKSTPPASSGARKRAQQKGKSTPKQAVPEVVDADNENVNIGADFSDPSGGAKVKPSSKSVKKASGPLTPVGSDSDVRLVADGSDVTFNIAKDSAGKRPETGKIVPHDTGKLKPGDPPSSAVKRSSKVSLGSGVQPPPKSGTSGKQQSPRPGNTPQPVDSGVRLVPMDSDSDVKLISGSDEVPLGEHPHQSVGSDSNVRLERVQFPSPGGSDVNLLLTDEINLDEELRKQEEREKNKLPGKVKPKSEKINPKKSPFELSDTDMKSPSEVSGVAGPKTPRMVKDGMSDSSDFELVTPALEEDSSDFDLQASNDSSPPDVSEGSSFDLEVSDDEQHVLQDDSPTELSGSLSGISLGNPADAGISLEEGGASRTDDELELDLTLQSHDTPKSVRSKPLAESSGDFPLKPGDTPRPGKSPAVDDSDSEFELNLESSSDEHSSLQTSESDEDDIDLSLSVDPDLSSRTSVGDDADSIDITQSRRQEDSDSEFELTLDDSSGSLASLDDDSAPQVKSKAGTDEEQDIFETDFEVPALDGSDDAMAAGSELESSDFDLALDDSELAVDEESGSQVVALDEEDAAMVDSDADAAAVGDVSIEEDSSDFGDLDQDVQVDEESALEEAAAPGEVKTVTQVKLVPAAPWGAYPVVLMLPCVIIMFLASILGYELVQSSTGLNTPGPLTLAVADMLGQKITLK